MNRANLRILVADDSTVMQSVVEKALHDEGYDSVDKVADGNQAVDAIAKAYNAKKPYGLALLDWNMPGPNGVEVLRYIRSKPELAKLTVIMITSEGEKNAVLKAISSGLDGFLLKPFESSALSDAIESAMQRRAKLTAKA